MSLRMTVSVNIQEPSLPSSTGKGQGSYKASTLGTHAG